MSAFAIFLVTVGSVLHLVWNVFAKQAHDKLAFLWLALCPLSFIGLVYFFFLDDAFFLGPPVLICLALSSLVHAFYFWSLMGAFEEGEISFVYPYARGIGTLVATVGGILFLEEWPKTTGFIGIALTIVGVLLVPTPTKTPSGAHKLRWKTFIFTGLTGASIGIYLLIDKVGLTYLQTVAYLFSMCFGTCLVLTPLVWRQGRILQEMKRSKNKSLQAGMAMLAAYALILLAMEMAPVSYVVATRASGIVLSVLLGRFFLHEKVLKIQWVSALTICLGVLCIGIDG